MKQGHYTYYIILNYISELLQLIFPLEILLQFYLINIFEMCKNLRNKICLVSRETGDYIGGAY